MQTRLQSFIEANVGTVVGFIGSFSIMLAVLRLMPGADDWTKTVVTTVLCTVWSIVRGYYVRRYFARRHK